MNYLGHWLFSDPTPDALMGSLWPDFGKRPSPDEVSEEFLVHFDRHQWLDKETDRTPILEPLRQALRPKLRKTTPIVVDMLIDHHLAKHWTEYHQRSLTAFTRICYEQSRRFGALTLPAKLEKTLNWMREDDWLAGYQDPRNVLRALAGLSRRLKFDDPMVQSGHWAITQAQHHKSQISQFLTHVNRSLN
ncbi:acyl carrier protein phosphodiesterase [Saccharospirillum salsuginis]|uniref:ACP phosphodiesterase n=1 Tax=Saccharospirillum salsuginis TaxID=418750 RepID=A0A918K2Y9_9GAMM|nr:acyl carrier protein phosphodiesterase [Saccharospirillum salsuginis]GGX44567.1 ACP phosphodiesterase [Saccharospirillum salsuginis]